jgi:hypothetical protein
LAVPQAPGHHGSSAPAATPRSETPR